MGGVVGGVVVGWVDEAIGEVIHGFNSQLPIFYESGTYYLLQTEK